VPNSARVKGSAVTSETHPIVTNVKAVLATPDKIIISWIENTDAAGYKLKWDKGDYKRFGFVDLTEVPSGTVYLTSKNTDGVLGSPEIKKNGGTFSF